jgi:two-component system chemotaxis response regulator CheB
MDMPEMDGLAVLDALKAMKDAPAVIVVSALTLQGGRLTIQALQKGAFDFITKPETAGAAQSRETLRAELAPRLKALALRLGVRGILRGTSGAAPQSSPAPKGEPASELGDIGQRMTRLAGTAKPEMVLIGVSTGGPNALSSLLPSLPARLGVPVLIVQHMPAVFTQPLAENLNGKCALQVREAANGELAEAGTVYIAPGGRQMRLAPGPEGRKLIQITDDPPENNCRPAVDYLFRSVANHFPGRAMGVILTGMGSDGTLGLRLLKRHGCFVIAQDAASCVVYGMPKAAVDAGVVDVILPLGDIAGRIVTTVRGGGI